ncbi:hypothetical protein [Culicoidibacter larvae]|uniref:hypothetical protein n=1 Tax=Culicoidibacter larvae TaxID=2579976 RepID=UPI0010FE91FD|nr:hypothetical protein [Culicoidibacter larvae]
MSKKFIPLFTKTILKNLPFPVILLIINYFDGATNMLMLAILFLAWLLLFSIIETIITIRKKI